MGIDEEYLSKTAESVADALESRNSKPTNMIIIIPQELVSPEFDITAKQFKHISLDPLQT